MDSGSYLNMCGRGTIGTVTMSINKGLISKKDVVLMDSPPGAIECKVTYENDEVNSISFRNVLSYMLYKDKSVYVPSIGKVLGCPKLYLRALTTSVKSHLFLFSEQLQFSLERCMNATGN